MLSFAAVNGKKSVTQLAPTYATLFAHNVILNLINNSSRILVRLSYNIAKCTLQVTGVVCAGVRVC